MFVLLHTSCAVFIIADCPYQNSHVLDTSPGMSLIRRSVTIRRIRYFQGLLTTDVLEKKSLHNTAGTVDRHCQTCGTPVLGIIRAPRRACAEFPVFSVTDHQPAPASGRHRLHLRPCRYRPPTKLRTLEYSIRRMQTPTRHVWKHSWVVNTACTSTCLRRFSQSRLTEVSMSLWIWLCYHAPPCKRSIQNPVTPRLTPLSPS